MTPHVRNLTWTWMREFAKLAIATVAGIVVSGLIFYGSISNTVSANAEAHAVFTKSAHDHEMIISELRACSAAQGELMKVIRDDQLIMRSDVKQILSRLPRRND